MLNIRLWIAWQKIGYDTINYKTGPAVYPGILYETTRSSLHPGAGKAPEEAGRTARHPLQLVRFGRAPDYG